jgi:hypothetical protein
LGGQEYVRNGVVLRGSMDDTSSGRTAEAEEGRGVEAEGVEVGLNNRRLCK